VITIGVDPGKSGAIALLDEGALVDVYDMPVAGSIVSAQQLHGMEMWSSSQLFGTVVIEDVHAMPKQGVTSSFGFGRSLGVIEGVFAANGRPIVYVSPSRWKKALGLGADKSMVRRRACELWPYRAALFTRVKDDGRAEAALIAHWWLTMGRKP
jgi:crossover junction endodeoxyribonuclease RuvC